METIHASIFFLLRIAIEIHFIRRTARHMPWHGLAWGAIVRTLSSSPSQHSSASSSSPHLSAHWLDCMWTWYNVFHGTFQRVLGIFPFFPAPHTISSRHTLAVPPLDLSAERATSRERRGNQKGRKKRDRDRERDRASEMCTEFRVEWHTHTHRSHSANETGKWKKRIMKCHSNLSKIKIT